MTWQNATLALGSNMAWGGLTPPRILLSALTALAKCADIRLTATSRFFRTPAFPLGSGNEFVNAAAAVQTSLSPEALLARLHEIEALHGRERSLRWGPRTLDLDLLWQGDALLPDAAEQHRWRSLAPQAQALEAPSRLILPHPRLQDRAFVLVPLCDIAPAQVVPGLGQTVAALTAALPQQACDEVRLWA